MTGKRIIAIGDIHGCINKLETLLDRLIIQRDDTVVVLGDYIGRGPSSKAVISTLIDLGKRVENMVCLMGNHENLLLEYVRTSEEVLLPYLRQQSIEVFLESYGQKDLSRLNDLFSFMPAEHVEFFNSLKLYYEEGDYFFVHAGLMPGLPFEEQTAMEFCEVRDVFLEAPVEIGKTVVFGHTPFETPLVTEDKIGIDTGAAYGNLLTAVVLPEGRFYHA